MTPLPGWRVVPVIDSKPIRLSPYHLREDEDFLYLCEEETVLAIFSADVVTVDVLESAIANELARQEETIAGGERS